MAWFSRRNYDHQVAGTSFHVHYSYRVLTTTRSVFEEAMITSCISLYGVTSIISDITIGVFVGFLIGILLYQ